MKHHTPLSPSGAFRWLNCALYCRAAMSGKLKSGNKPPHPAAIMGTEKHNLMESFLRSALPKPVSLTEQWEASLESLIFPDNESDFLLDFLTNLQRSNTYLIEKELPIPGIIAAGVEQIVRGTIDLSFYYEDERKLTIIDWKFGRRLVSADRNPQLSLYAKAAALKIAKPVEKLEKIIVQPAIGHKDVALIASPNFSKPVKAAYQGGVKAVAKLGKWCDFCELQGICPKYIKAAKGSEIADATDFC